MPLPRTGSLEVADHQRLQERGWRLQRIGWICMALFVVAAAAGVFGSGGPASRATATAAGLTIEYPRFTRRQTPETLRIRFSAEAVLNGEVRAWVERSYLDQATVEAILPPPIRVIAAPDRLTYVFAAEGAGALTFHLQFDEAGVPKGRLGIGATELSVRHVVYP